MKKLLLLCVLLSASIYGCGGSSEGLLATSSVTSSIDTLVLDSDVVSWVDATGAKATACSATSFPATPAADSVNVTIKSTAYPLSGSTSLSLRIKSATISYTPANTATPPMSAEFQTVGMTIESGSSATIPVRVATQEQKIRLQPTLACNNTIYKYYTKITFDIAEIGSDKNITVDSSMDLRLADFIDK